MPYIYSEMQNKLSKTRESPLESMGQIISSRCPGGGLNYIGRCARYCYNLRIIPTPWEVTLSRLFIDSFGF